jgi:hypothetical protein
MAIIRAKSVPSHFENSQFGTCIVIWTSKAMLDTAPPAVSVTWHLRDCGGLDMWAERERGN